MAEANFVRLMGMVLSDSRKVKVSNSLLLHFFLIKRVRGTINRVTFIHHIILGIRSF